MVLKPDNTAELVRLLKALPEQKRRVIIFTGEHPNEGTHILARRHHKEWERSGAAVVLFPGKLTIPFAITEAARAAHLLEKSRKIHWADLNFADVFLHLPSIRKATVSAFQRKRAEKNLSRLPRMKDLITLLRLNGISSPVIDFHATTAPHWRDSATWKPKDPNLITFIDSDSALKTKIPEAKVLPTYRRGGMHPDWLGVELQSFGNKNRTGFAHRRFKLDEPGYQEFKYLTDPVVSRETLDFFKSNLNDKFILLIRRLAGGETQ
ncbi:MAG: hypothetical protein ABH863_04585 [Candidatus Micrarchaeota archaeon]